MDQTPTKHYKNHHHKNHKKPPQENTQHADLHTGLHVDLLHADLTPSRRSPRHQAYLKRMILLWGSEETEREWGNERDVGTEREPKKSERREMWEIESWRENKEINKILYNLATVRSQK